MILWILLILFDRLWLVLRELSLRVSVPPSVGFLVSPPPSRQPAQTSGKQEDPYPFRRVLHAHPAHILILGNQGHPETQTPSLQLGAVSSHRGSQLVRDSATVPRPCGSVVGRRPRSLEL